MQKNKREKETLEGNLQKKLVEEIKTAFYERQLERKLLERSWQLNMNFLAGNQYCVINPIGNIEEEERQFYWQYQRVFNHIAPIIETRCAKLAQIRPILTVRATTCEEGDCYTAQMASNLLQSIREESNLHEVIARTTTWSETCGTAFYKVIWDNHLGKEIAPNRYEGSVRILSLSPFEIYPQSLCIEDIQAQPSIIHARVVPIEEVERCYGISIQSEEFEENIAVSHLHQSTKNTQKNSTYLQEKNSILVIEYYQKASNRYPNGRFIAIAGDKLLYNGELPYINGEQGRREYPFIKQTSIPVSGSFFGSSIIERLIPIQRAFNAVKNRKHEFLNRLTMGVLAVEDGSVDVQELLEEGLPAGKVLVYRQGANIPHLLGTDSIPAEFNEEEERLLDEFTLISGVSELTSNSHNRTNVTSATGLQLLLDQDETRLVISIESLKHAMIKISKHILRLMRQFAKTARLLRLGGEGKKVKMYYFTGTDITSDDVIIDTEIGDIQSITRRRNFIYDIYNLGLFAGEDGRVDDETKMQILKAMGLNNLHSHFNLITLHKNKASEENLNLTTKALSVDYFDDDKIHIDEHIRYLLSSEFDNSTTKKAVFIEHIQEHERQLLQKENNKNIENA